MSFTLAAGLGPSSVDPSSVVGNSAVEIPLVSTVCTLGWYLLFPSVYKLILIAAFDEVPQMNFTNAVVVIVISPRLTFMLICPSTIIGFWSKVQPSVVEL